MIFLFVGICYMTISEVESWTDNPPTTSSLCRTGHTMSIYMSKSLELSVVACEVGVTLEACMITLEGTTPRISGTAVGLC